MLTIFGSGAMAVMPIRQVLRRLCLARKRVALRRHSKHCGTSSPSAAGGEFGPPMAPAPARSVARSAQARSSYRSAQKRTDA
jgi:hypothetical protein